MSTPIEHVKGNASATQKEAVNNAMSIYHMPGCFQHDVGHRIRITEADVLDDPEANKMGAVRSRILRVVFEVKVTQDMCHSGNSLHGGCTAYLADVCTSAAYALDDRWGFNHVSTALNVVYHAPAPKSCTLRIVCTVVSLGARVATSRCEIWNRDKGRLCASATHVKMQPSKAKL